MVLVRMSGNVFRKTEPLFFVILDSSGNIAIQIKTLSS